MINGYTVEKATTNITKVTFPGFIGDKFWYIEQGEVKSDEITGISLTADRIVYFAGHVAFDNEDIGKDVFFSEEEAEQQLKEREEE